MSCCGNNRGEARAYYWTGTSCAPDKHCACDALPAVPDWPTQEACEDAHRGCPRDRHQ